MKKCLIIILIISFGLASCFKDIDTIELDPLETITATYSIEDYQSYYKIEENEIRLVKYNEPADWDLGFETGAEEWHIILNFSAAAKIINTEIPDINDVDINTANDLIKSDNWKFDHPNGDMDQTAIGNWIDTAKVYILNRGTAFKNEEAYYKIKFESVDAEKYKIKYADLNIDELFTQTIRKNDEFKFVSFSLGENKIKLIDPGKNKWDLLFTPYYGYYKTLIGSYEPYFLRGVYINYLNGVDVIKIKAPDVKYEDIDLSYIDKYENSSEQDAIGYDWKMIPNPPDYRYYIDESIKYIIHALDGNYYKFRFISFYNEDDLKGYPVFEYKLLI